LLKWTDKIDVVELVGCNADLTAENFALYMRPVHIAQIHILIPAEGQES
jgi:hypothetical protein